jgi:site-specific DNA-methyltransferase (adenine-specific)
VKATALDVLEGRAAWSLERADFFKSELAFDDAALRGAVDHVVSDPPYEKEAHTLGRRLLRGKTVKGLSGGREILQAPLSFGALTQSEREMCGILFAHLAARWSLVFCQVEGAMKWQDALTNWEGSPHQRRRIGIWVKPDGMPQLRGDRPGMGYESIVMTHSIGASRWNGGGRLGVFTHTKNTPGGKHLHETQKPLPLMLELIELFTDPGDVVLDPFAGSGTTGVACLRLGRRFIGFEKDAKYARLAQQQLEAEARGLSLRDVRAGQTSIFDVMSEGE